MSVRHICLWCVRCSRKRFKFLCSTALFLLVLLFLCLNISHVLYLLHPCPPLKTNLSWTPEALRKNGGAAEKGTSSIDCKALFSRNKDEIIRAKYFKRCYRADQVSDLMYVEMSKNCQKFRQDRGYDWYVNTEEEKNFPIAFSILTYEHVEQTERLLRAIHRPQNVYCIHIDAKSPSTVHQALKAIASCLENVFVSTVSVPVRWAEFSVLAAEVACLKDLWKIKTWKYFINLTGREFPIRTNLELVKILKAYNGANDIDGTPHTRPVKWTEYVWKREFWMTSQRKSSPPPKVLITKGSAHIAATRAFIDYALHNKTAQDLLHWVRDIRAPDEHFFSSLNHSPHLGIPGAFKGDPDLKLFYTRFKIWQTSVESCEGSWVRLICNLGAGDLHRLTKAKEMFVNKLRIEQEPVAFECMEQWYRNRTLRGRNPDFNVSFYERQLFVKQHV